MEMNRFGGVEERSEIAFFDLETTNPKVTGQECLLLEFGAILVCPRTLEEIDYYDTLVKPPNLSMLPETSFRGSASGITRDTVSNAPTFPEIADKVYDILHGRIWAGHFIAKFDCVRIRQAFAEIGRLAPEPKGIIDSVPLLRKRFGRRAGNVKLARLAEYFKLGKQTHRSLDDVRMNLKVIKYCSTVLFLESSLPDMLSINSLVSPNATTSEDDQEESASSDCYEIEDPNLVRQDTSEADPLDMDILIDQIAPEPVQSEAERQSPIDSPCCDGYLEPEQVLVPSLKAAALVPTLDRGQRIKLVNELHLRCAKLKLCYQVSIKYWPRLSICVQSSPSLCQVLDHCDYLARKFLMDSGRSSGWWPVVNRSMSPPTIRLHIPTTNGDSPIYSTEMYKKEASGIPQKLIFSKVDVTELNCLFIPGILIDAFFSLDVYDNRQNAGLSLVAEKLIINS